MFIYKDNRIFFSYEECENLEKFYVEQTTVVDELGNNSKDDNGKGKIIFDVVNNMIYLAIMMLNSDFPYIELSIDDFILCSKQMIDKDIDKISLEEINNLSNYLNNKLEYKNIEKINNLKLEQFDSMVQNGRLFSQHQKIEMYNFALIYCLQDASDFVDRELKKINSWDLLIKNLADKITINISMNSK